MTGMRCSFCVELPMENSQHSPEHVWPSPENPSLHLQLYIQHLNHICVLPDCTHHRLKEKKLK